MEVVGEAGEGKSGDDPCRTLRVYDYLDPKSMQNNGHMAVLMGFRAIMLHTFGVWVLCLFLLPQKTLSPKP